MIVKITCACRASFEIKDGSRHPQEILCPNCGRSLPSNASKDLLTALDALEVFETKLEDSRYNFSFSRD